MSETSHSCHKWTFLLYLNLINAWIFPSVIKDYFPPVLKSAIFRLGNCSDPPFEKYLKNNLNKSEGTALFSSPFLIYSVWKYIMGYQIRKFSLPRRKLPFSPPPPYLPPHLSRRASRSIRKRKVPRKSNGKNHGRKIFVFSHGESTSLL